MKRILVIILSLLFTTVLFSACHNEQTIVEEPDTSITQEQEVANESLTKLSDNYTILASGSEENGDTYELVGTQSETYNSVQIEIGVIKNNEWLVPLSSDNPFIGDNGLLFSVHPLRSTGMQLNLNNVQDYKGVHFSYLGNGCFIEYYHYYDNSKPSYNEDNVEANSNGVVYNSENENYFIMDENNYLRFPPLDSCGDYLVLCNHDMPYSYDYLSTLNLQTMEVTELSFSKSQKYRLASPNSENLFLVQNIETDVASNDFEFYDMEGNKVIDLSEYNIINAYSLYEPYNESSYYTGNILYFENGKCEFETSNDAGTKYLLTIDKNGNLLNEEIVQ